MEKHGRSKGNILQFIPSANSVTFHKTPISPGRDKKSETWSKCKHKPRRGFSGPLPFMFPDESRRKSRNNGFDASEPTSPKVSCMGQIIQKHKKLKNNNKTQPLQPQNLNRTEKQKKMNSKSMPLTSHRDSYKPESSPKESKKKPLSGILKLLHKRTSRSDLFGVSDKDRPVQVQGSAPSLGNMKRLVSGRNSLADFNWTDHVPAVSDDRNYHSDEEAGKEDDEDSIIIPHSAPIIVVGGRVALEPRKEVNLWKRRTTGPPQPLQLAD